jgi:hypothetical protein
MIDDGIVTVGFDSSGNPTGPANHVKVIGNVLTGNLNSGIDLNSTAHSVAFGNKSNGNGIGINVADDLGVPATKNLIALNVTNQNTGGCGIALADHSGAGVTDNVVLKNVSNNNGLSTPTAPDASAGSGVILAAPIPNGIVTGNLITQNKFSGNGHAGVVIHAHAPGDDFSGTVISKNLIGTNNVRQDENDTQTTGIYLGSLSPQTVTVTGNQIHDDYYGIFMSGPVQEEHVPPRHPEDRHVRDLLGRLPGPAGTRLPARPTKLCGRAGSGVRTLAQPTVHRAKQKAPSRRASWVAANYGMRGHTASSVGHGGPARIAARSSGPARFPSGNWSSRSQRHAATIARTSRRQARSSS